MGIFDSSMFDSGNYGGILGNLLQQLQASQQQPQPSQGFPDSTQSYGAGGMQYPVMGQPQQAPVTPPGAETFQNQAPPMQPQAPQPQQAPKQLLGSGIFANAPPGSLRGFIGDLTGQSRNPTQAIYEALRQIPGMPDATAQAAALDPEIRKTIAPQLYSKPQLEKLKGIAGEDVPYIYRADTATLTPAFGGGGSGAVGGGGINALAPGVTQLNPNASGEDYLNQFSPEVKAAVKAYMNGDVMPTGNPRQQGISTIAKTIAQKYGQDIGVPVNDQTFAAKRKMQTDVASSANGSMGGILSNGKSALEHLFLHSKNLLNVGSVGGDEDTPGSGVAATASNYIRNKILPTGTQKGALSAANDSALHYGQESTKFYAATGGGEAERMGVLNNQNPATTTSDEQAAYLNTEKELLLGRFRQKENQIRDVLGQDYLDRHPVIDPQTQKILDGIDANIAKLRSGRPKDGATAPAVAAPAGWSIKKL